MLKDLPEAVIVLTGSELLDGRTRDTNGAFLSSELQREGAEVAALLVVPDDRGRLLDAIRFALAARPAVVLLSGGLGTTHDDLTAACLAEAAGVPLVEHPEALEMVAERTRAVADRRRMAFEEIFPVTRRQALLPEGARPVPPAGIAPGIALRIGSTRAYALPGVPFELRAMWKAVRDELAAEGVLGEVSVRVLRTFGVGELQVSAVVDAARRDLLDVAVNVDAGEVAVRLRHAPDEAARRQADDLVAALETALPVFSTDGRTVDDLVADGLRARRATVAVAESCTGGALGKRLTDRPGSSDYVLGGVISYADEVKRTVLGVPQATLAEHGAVSEPVAAAMAEGVRRLSGSSYALSVTGVAGPDGGTPQKPVGLVCLGCAGPSETRVVREQFPGDRSSVREWSVIRALHLLHETLEEG